MVSFSSVAWLGTLDAGRRDLVDMLREEIDEKAERQMANSMREEQRGNKGINICMVWPKGAWWQSG